tara:strand:+ start:68 stop:472 length:405 start_codon:yes stop_codon:yes gene_type:complete
MDDSGSIHSEDYLNPTDNNIPLNIEKNKHKDNINKIEYYYQNVQGKRIINALSGRIYNYKVGSKDEYIFFRTVVAMHKDGITDGVKLFYDTPDDYERHWGVILDNEIKQRWKYKINKININSNLNKRKHYTIVK